MMLIDLDKIKPMDFPSYEMDGVDVVQYLATLPTVEAVPVAHGPCGFCGKFEFETAKATVDRYGAHIELACASTIFPIEEQFNFCPVCGRFVKKG